MSSTQQTSETSQTGAMYAIGAYSLWGLVPIYWHYLIAISPIEILSHRIVWSFLFYWILVASRRPSALAWLKLLRSPELARSIAAASILLTINWLLYIWAVNNGHIIESSLGYFITPLLNVMMGRLILKEKLTRLRWAAMAIATIGVLVLAIYTGHVPWIALGLAGSFSTYGLLRKRIPANVFETSTAETSIVLIPALATMVYFRWLAPAAAPFSLLETTLLVASGVVTGVPLIWFANAARMLPLSSLGFFQYLAPSIQFAIGLFVYGEPFSPVQFQAFLFIWMALAVFSYESLRRVRKQSKS